MSGDEGLPVRVQLRWVLRGLRPRWLRRSAMSANDLTNLTGEGLADEIMKRRAAYQRSLSRAKEIGDDELFEASVGHLLGDVQVMRGTRLEVTMYAATVTDHGGGFDIRGMWPTRAIAIQRLEIEVARKGNTLEWDSYGEHAVSKPLAGLQYHVDPVKVYA